MIKKKDAYEILRTNREAINIRKDEQARNAFVKSKAEDAKREIYIKIYIIEKKLKNVQGVQKQLLIVEKKQLESQLEEIDNAYMQVCDDSRRQYYDLITSTGNQIEREDKKQVHQNAYEMLFTSREYCNNPFEQKRIDKFLEKMHTTILRSEQDLLTTMEEELKKVENDSSNKSFRQKYKLQTDIAHIREKIAKIDQAYEQIRTKDAREEYNMKLDKEKEQEQEKLRQSQLKKKYKVKANPNNVHQVAYRATTQTKQDNLEKNATQNLPINLIRKDGTQISLERIGLLAYRMKHGITGKIEQYRIMRTILGQQKCDERYVNINRAALSINPTTGEIKNKKYYEFVANELLSEDSIEGAKYNQGYLGEVLKEKNDNYYQSLKNSDELSAVTKLAEQIELERLKGKEHEQ